VFAKLFQLFRNFRTFWRTIKIQLYKYCKDTFLTARKNVRPIEIVTEHDCVLFRTQLLFRIFFAAINIQRDVNHNLKTYVDTRIYEEYLILLNFKQN
jgi:hypothetical protein